MKIKRLLYVFLRKLEKAEGKRFELTGKDLGVTEEELHDVIRFADKEGYVTKPLYADNRPYYYESIRLTMKGTEFLEQNSLLAKTYRGLKHVLKFLQ